MNKNLFDLTGKVAVITGSTRGIGKAIAEAMADHGAKVVISSRKAGACEEVAATIRGAGAKAIAIPCNISRREELDALVSGAIRHWGKIDILVCNAAVNPYYGPMSGVAEDAYDKIMDTNVKSNLWLCNKVLPGMAARKDGVVIIVSSIGGLKGHAKLGVYGLSKAADFQLARNLAVEWGRDNIRANCIAPGIIRTDFARALWEDPRVYAQAVSTYPLGRIGEPDEVAGAAVMLASRAGSFITGQAIVIDGGSTIAAGSYS
ncbi:MAG TPA: SDR family oxidoreductase [Alphaproteobacteria bacterium]|nr:SDR family oxidoreductase [Alphaproteobacteria bacterium]